jgi:amino-acid N-acetyltransferase
MIQENRQASEPKPRIDAASPADLANYLELLARAGLPPEGLAECLPDALVARRDDLVEGAVALEIYGDQALLRSLVVDAAMRGAGLGGALVDAALGLARRRGAATVHLLTETAAPFFAHRGFKTIARDDVPTAVQASVQFRSVCPQSATAMTLALAPNPTTPSTTVNR